MTQLIDSHAVLKSSPIIGDAMLFRYRLTCNSSCDYAVHAEYRELGGASGEAFLYQGNDLNRANAIYNKLVKG